LFVTRVTLCLAPLDSLRSLSSAAATHAPLSRPGERRPLPPSPSREGVHMANLRWLCPGWRGRRSVLSTRVRRGRSVGVRLPHDRWVGSSRRRTEGSRLMGDTLVGGTRWRRLPGRSPRGANALPSRTERVTLAGKRALVVRVPSWSRGVRTLEPGFRTLRPWRQDTGAVALGHRSHGVRALTPQGQRTCPRG
jgi:hypothetical protein